MCKKSTHAKLALKLHKNIKLLYILSYKQGYKAIYQKIG